MTTTKKTPQQIAHEHVNLWIEGETFGSLADVIVGAINAYRAQLPDAAEFADDVRNLHILDYGELAREA